MTLERLLVRCPWKRLLINQRCRMQQRSDARYSTDQLLHAVQHSLFEVPYLSELNNTHNTTSLTLNLIEDEPAN